MLKIKVYIALHRKLASLLEFSLWLHTTLKCLILPNLNMCIAWMLDWEGFLTGVVIYGANELDGQIGQYLQ